MFLGVSSQKASLLLPFILLHVGILYSSKFVLTAKSWGTKAAVICVTTDLCIIQLVMLVHQMQWK